MYSLKGKWILNGIFRLDFLWEWFGIRSRGGVDFFCMYGKICGGFWKFFLKTPSKLKKYSKKGDWISNPSEYASGVGQEAYRWGWFGV